MVWRTDACISTVTRSPWQGPASWGIESRKQAADVERERSGNKEIRIMRGEGDEERQDSSDDRVLCWTDGNGDGDRARVVVKLLDKLRRTIRKTTSRGSRRALGFADRRGPLSAASAAKGCRARSERRLEPFPCPAAVRRTTLSIREVNS